jgi:hypothetical protein
VRGVQRAIQFNDRIEQQAKRARAMGSEQPGLPASMVARIGGPVRGIAASGVRIRSAWTPGRMREDPTPACVFLGAEACQASLRKSESTVLGAQGTLGQPLPRDQPDWQDAI